MKALILACSKTKADAPAFPRELYRGVLWTELARHPSGLPQLRLFVLSAEHGLLETCRHRIAPYDRKMTPARAQALAKQIRAQWIQSGCDEAIVVGGADYQQAAELAGIPIAIRLDGRGPAGARGLGILRKRWRAFLTAIHREANRHAGPPVETIARWRADHPGPRTTRAPRRNSTRKNSTPQPIQQTLCLEVTR